MWKCPVRVLVLAALACAAINAQSPRPAMTYYPDREWRTATPESQGIDSRALAALSKGMFGE